MVPVTRNTGDPSRYKVQVRTSSRFFCLGCKIESEFRKHFGRSGRRSNIFLDIIAIETPMEIGEVGVRVKVPSWDNIETKGIA